MVTIFELEKYMATTHIFYIIAKNLSYWEKPNLIIFLIIDKNLKKNLYNTILPFGLIINL